MENRPINNFDYLYKTYKAGLYNYTYKMVGNNIICEDIIQVVFMKLYENLGRIRNYESSRYWLYKTTRNEIFKYYRTKQVHVDQYKAADADEIDPESESNVEVEFDMKELSAYVAGELEKLSADQKEVYVLKEYSGLSYKEIAEITGIEENVLRKRFFDAKNKLIEKLSNIYLTRG